MGITCNRCSCVKTCTNFDNLMEEKELYQDGAKQSVNQPTINLFSSVFNNEFIRKSIYNVDVNNKNVAEETKKEDEKVLKMQSAFRGYKFRKSLEEYNVKVSPEKEEELNKKINSFILPSVLENEKRFKNPIDYAEDYKKFYTEEEYKKLMKNYPFGYDFEMEGLFYSKGIFSEYERDREFDCSSNINISTSDKSISKRYYNRKSSTLIRKEKIKSLYIGYLTKYFLYHGKGKLYLQDGEKLEGIFYNGKLNGWGRYINEKNECFEGFFKDDKLTGKGYELYLDENNNNCLYEGEFVNFKKEGEGIERTDVILYDGKFKKDKKHGYGKLSYNNSCDVYQGEFSKGLINGYGHYVWDNGHEYIGDFVNGKMEGKGKYKWPDGSVYIGLYKDNIKEGLGEFTWPDGRIYTGQFANGKPNGKGCLKVNDIIIKDAKFKDGVFVGNLKQILKKESERSNKKSPRAFNQFE